MELAIELCNWMQNSYTTQQPEKLNGKLTFFGICEFELIGKNKKRDLNQILQINIDRSNENFENDIFEIVVLGSTGEVKVLKIIGGTVMWSQEL